MTLSDKIRGELRDALAPCQSCGHARMTITALSKALGQPASSVGRYLAGGKPSVALLDAADAWLQDQARAVVEPLLTDLGDRILSRVDEPITERVQ